jgi:hypothetical protein
MPQPETTLVAFQCPRCSKFTDLTIDTERLRKFFATPLRDRPLIQEAFPDLTPSQREVLKTGYCDTCWDTLFGEPT